MKRRKFIASAGAATAFATVIPSLKSFAATPSQMDAGIIKTIRDRIRPITNEERLQRQEKARQLMADNKLDAIFMRSAEARMSYYTGAAWGRSERLFAMLLPRKGEPVYISPAFEEGRAREQTGHARVYTWQENESPYELLKKMFADAGLL